jgi:hypothetical protein
LRVGEIGLFTHGNTVEMRQLIRYGVLVVAARRVGQTVPANVAGANEMLSDTPAVSN